MSDFFRRGYPFIEMNNLSDQELLREYVSKGSEPAFAELVQRHVNFVYSVALRMVDDSHEAEDIAQNVFIALNKQARELIDHPVLSGWLHRTARNLSINSVRSATRRRTREQNAVAMNELHSSESDAQWIDVAPVLDVALGELNDTERDAVLLRYFERKPASEIANVLGISSEAAQKRVNRGIDRLRELFAKRGVAVAASGLAGLLTANAVQGAPAGLAATIASATFGGAGAHVSSAAVVTKTVFMTTIQKALVGAVLAVAIGAALYQTQQCVDMSQQTQKLLQQQASLSARVQQAEADRDNASNQLAALNKQLTELKLSNEQRELLRLRGEVSTLRQKQPGTNQLSGLARMMNDPAAREYNRQIILKGIRTRYAPLFQELKLNSEKVEQFTQRFSELYMKFGQIVAEQKENNFTPEEIDRLTADAQREFGKDLRAILGEDGVKRMQEFTQEIPARTAMHLLNDQLAGAPLNAEQATQLFAIIRSEPYELLHGIEGDMNTAFMGSPQEMQRYLARLEECNQRIITQASKFLTADQVNALGIILTNAVNTRLAQAAAVFGKKP